MREEVKRSVERFTVAENQSCPIFFNLRFISGPSGTCRSLPLL